jgi:arginine repressor
VVAERIDAFADSIGTLAGDDTILVIARDARQAKALVKRFEAIAAGQ